MGPGEETFYEEAFREEPMIEAAMVECNAAPLLLRGPGATPGF
jgi:hypothetical protein